MPEENGRPRRNVGPKQNLVHGGNDPFVCSRCGEEVRPLSNGSIRNHCPRCLWSLHVDRVPGDRAESCLGPMRPYAVEGSVTRGWDILFRCERCGAERRNRAAPDDPRQPDSWEAIVALSVVDAAPNSRSAKGRRSPRRPLR